MKEWRPHNNTPISYIEEHQPFDTSGLELELVIHDGYGNQCWIGERSGSLYLCGYNLKFYTQNFGYWNGQHNAEKAVNAYYAMHGKDFVV